MKKMGLLFFMLCFAWQGLVYAQLGYGVKLGANIGSPIGKIDEGARGKLGIAPNLLAFGQYYFNDKSSIWAGVGYSQKKSSFFTPVTDKPYTQRDSIYNPFADTTIYITVQTTFTGTIDGIFDNQYIELPVVYQYRFSKAWSLMAGGYVAYLIKGKNTGTASGIVGDTQVPDPLEVTEPFDESAHISPMDYGALLGVNFEAIPGLSLEMRLTGGLRSVFDADYENTDGVIRNAYMQLAAGYQFNSPSTNKSAQE